MRFSCDMQDHQGQGKSYQSEWEAKGKTDKSYRDLDNFDIKKLNYMIVTLSIIV